MSDSLVEFYSLMQLPNMGTEAAWDLITLPVPQGLIIYAPDTGTVKVGDGEHMYVELSSLGTLSSILAAIGVGGGSPIVFQDGTGINVTDNGNNNFTIGSNFNSMTQGSGINISSDGNGNFTIIATGGGGGGGVTYPQIVQSASIEAGGTLALPNPVTVGNYLAVFVNQATALADFNGVPLLQTAQTPAGSSVGQTLLFGQVATSTTGPSAVIYGNGYIVEVSRSSSQSSSVVTMGAKNGETVSCTVSVAAGSILLFATTPYGGSGDDTVMIAPSGVTWLSSGQLVGYQAYGFGIYSVPCPVTNPALQIALRSPSQAIGYAAVLELTY